METHRTWSIAGRRRILSILIVLGLGLLGCAQVPQSLSAADVVKYVVPEEQSIQQTCHILKNNGSYRDSALGQVEEMKGAVQDADSTLRALQRNDAETNVRALLSALQLSSCEGTPIDVDQIAARSAKWLDQSSGCYRDLRTALDPTRPTKLRMDPAAEKIVAALTAGEKATPKDAEAAVQNVLERMRSIVARIDFSPAVVLAAVRVAEGAEYLADNLAENVPAVPGLARVVLRQLAAELVAMTLDAVLTELESQALTTPSSVARYACGLHGSTERGVVVSRMLRRAILRFNPWATPKGAVVGESVRYPSSRICESIRSESSNPCGNMLGKLRGEEDAVADLVLTPSLPPTSAAGRRSDATLPDARAPHFPHYAGPKLGDVLREATKSCSLEKKEIEEGGRPECTLETLSEIAGILSVFRSETNASLQKLAVDVGSIHGELGAIHNVLGGMRRSLDSLRTSVDSRNQCDHLSNESAPKAQQGSSATATVAFKQPFADANLRERPDKGAANLGKVPLDSCVTLLPEEPRADEGSQGGVWYRVSFKGTSGWLHRNSLVVGPCSPSR